MFDFFKSYKDDIKAQMKSGSSIEQLPKTVQENIGDSPIEQEEIQITIETTEVQAELFTVNGMSVIWLDPIHALRAGIDFVDGVLKEGDK